MAVLACLSSPACAEDCGPLKQLNSLDLVAPNPNRALIPVSLNGIPKLFLLDTGGDVSQISGQVATELGLTQHDANIKMLDLYGHASDKYVRIEKLGVGRLMRHGHQSGDLSPIPISASARAMSASSRPDLMGRYDIEIDFGTYKMNYFSPDHCAGHVVYWPHNALAVLPFTFHKRHIRFTVKVDGKDLSAEMDTGAPNTVMHAEAARRLFDLEPDSPGNLPLNAQGMAAAFLRIFSTLDFEGVGGEKPACRHHSATGR